MAPSLGFFDYFVLLAYLLGTIALGVAIGRRVKTGKDFFLGGRSLPWWAIGMSLVATDIGGTDIIGVGGAAYSYGLAVANFEWIGCVPAMIVAAFVFVPHFWRIGVYTIPEFMERRYNVAVRTALALCWLAFMACNLGIMLFASARMMIVTLGIDLGGVQLLGWSLGGTEMLLCIVGIAVVAGVYTLAGGLSAVVYTDALQCAVLIAGCLLVLGCGLVEVGGVGALAEKVAAREAEQASDEGRGTEHNELILPVDTETPFPWPGILFGLALVLSPAYWIGNQAIVQRSLGARSAFHAKAAYIWGALLKNIIPLVIALPGLVAFALLPDLEDGDNAFPTLATMLLPVGLRGLFLAAFLAALMSSVDSYLNAAATIFTRDLFQRFASQSDDDVRLLHVGRIVTLCLVLWAIGFAVFCSTIEGSGIYAIFQTLMSFFQGPALAILLCAVFWRRANGIGAFVGFVCGVATAVGLFTLSVPAVPAALGMEPLFRISEPFLYFSVWAFLVTLATLTVVSLFTPRQPAHQVDPLIYRVRGQTS
jgi:SSS family solute:Na+ symporter